MEQRAQWHGDNMTNKERLELNDLRAQQLAFPNKFRDYGQVNRLCELTMKEKEARTPTLKPAWECPKHEPKWEPPPDPNADLKEAIELVKAGKADEIDPGDLHKWLSELLRKKTYTGNWDPPCDCRRDPRATGHEIR